MTSIIRHKKKTPRFKAKSNYVKPFLTPANIEARLRYAMSFVRPLSNRRHSFSNMLDFVHVDEKWFNLTKVKRRYYAYDDEEVAARSVKSKHYITKLMFPLRPSLQDVFGRQGWCVTLRSSVGGVAWKQEPPQGHPCHCSSSRGHFLVVCGAVTCSSNKTTPALTVALRQSCFKPKVCVGLL
ncbi:hypothetical protein H257_01696 [Aphanomyces astaci]|uniref:Uncharacterized protein n=1 Tax=Aphanomyces astaci TaxID=112090 RepID=W4H3C8_APHAT|nr:hypothetical protein H257_01696 [Aphanomyces astaci]ETV86520.1 hypothetical protein H257_01696 [Aphanomyces astaci]|eukprot:XP_009823319.1 hypothetical protein H257_01696 [Aphanomyces astaci]